jgi:3-dehydroquinate synthase
MDVNIRLKKEIDSSYKVFIDSIPKLHFEDRKVAIVTNPKVSGLHLSYLLNRIEAKEIQIITIPDGEKYKNWESVSLILESLFNARFDRKSLLISFGGGVIGDITGFTASIFQRGIDFIQIPTTLLAQVDASVGGKTAINHEYGKNLIGVFSQPKAVYIDSSFLLTLPEREFSAGVAEIIKMAVTLDPNFFSWLENNSLKIEENLQYAIVKSVQLKAKVVSLDEKEQGHRAVLNYGHTFGHVIENETKYSKYLHGEAVAIGIVMANRLAVKMGSMGEIEANKVKKLLDSYDLPTSYKIDSVDEFYEKFFLDKKSNNNSLTFIISNGIGDFSIEKNIDEDLIKETLQEFTNGN